jgi:hypothetical protein
MHIPMVVTYFQDHVDKSEQVNQLLKLNQEIEKKKKENSEK